MLKASCAAKLDLPTTIDSITRVIQIKNFKRTVCCSYLYARISTENCVNTALKPTTLLVRQRTKLASDCLSTHDIVLLRAISDKGQMDLSLITITIHFIIPLT